MKHIIEQTRIDHHRSANKSARDADGLHTVYIHPTDTSVGFINCLFEIKKTLSLREEKELFTRRDPAPSVFGWARSVDTQ